MNLKNVCAGTSLCSQETPGKGSWLHNLGWRSVLPPINFGGCWPNPTTEIHVDKKVHMYINIEDCTHMNTLIFHTSMLMKMLSMS